LCATVAHVNYWLMKSEPETFAITDLARVGVEPWTGVRNLMARNFMRAMTVGDEVLFYHSSCVPPGVAGLARVARTAVIDETQFDPASPYFDPRSQRDKPRWDCVDVTYVETLPRLVSLDELRGERALHDMMLFKWMRLSVQPVSAEQFAHIVELSRHAAPPLVVRKPAAKRKPAPKAKPAVKRARPQAKRKAAPRGRPSRRRQAARS
jgi:predicted RNA-binding protein with PUA-like domain